MIKNYLLIFFSVLIGFSLGIWSVDHRIINCKIVTVYPVYQLTGAIGNNCAVATYNWMPAERAKEWIGFDPTYVKICNNRIERN